MEGFSVIEDKRLNELLEIEKKYNDSNYIRISVKEYDDLNENRIWMSYLDSAGIDNTEAYDYAITLRSEEDPDWNN
jgi:hypothetical protein